MRMDSRFIAAALLASTGFVLTGGVQAAEQAVAAEEGPSAPAEAAIPFADMGSIRDWKAIDDETLYVQDIRRNWYIAKLMRPSPDLMFATAIGIETRGLNRLDKFGVIIVNGQRYQLSSLVTSGPPPSDKDADKG